MVNILFIIKVILSIPIAVGLAYPFFRPDMAGGILNEFKMLGSTWVVAAATVFLLLIFLYARDLANSLRLVSPESRKASPRGVWLMFLIPYNFIEDFCIISNVANSLRAEAASNPALAEFKSYGMASGLGWCTAQVVALIPNFIGEIAGLIAMVLWIWHWAFVRRANLALRNSLAS